MPPVSTAEAAEGVVPRLRPFESPENVEEADDDEDEGEEDEDEEEDASSMKKEGERGIEEVLLEPPPGGAVPIIPPPILPSRPDIAVGVETSRCKAGIEAEALICRPKPPLPPPLEWAECGDAEVSAD
jgi:hypothetical protein